MSNIEVYIPTDDSKFDLFQSIFVRAVTTYGKHWEIPEEEIQKLTAQQVLWKDIRIKAYSYHMGDPIKRKNEIKRDYMKLIRPFVQTWIIKNQKMTDLDRMKVGFKMKPKPRAWPIPPFQIPDILIKYLDEGNQVRVRMIPPKKRSQFGMIKKRGKPQDVEYVQIVYDIGEHKGGPTECRFRVIISKMFTTLYFEEADAGKMVTLYARYMNEKHEPGNWSSAKMFRIR